MTKYSKKITSLRIKRKYLAAETRIIKAEEQRAKKKGMTGYGSLHDHIYQHRILELRVHCRNNHLAHCYITGTPYLKAEPKCKEAPDWRAIEKICRRFSDDFDTAAFEAWRSTSTEGVKQAA